MTGDAVFGGAGPEAPARVLRAGPLTALVAGGDLFAITHDGIEVVRRIACPIRDANWATLAIETVAEEETGDTAYRHVFRAGPITGEVRFDLRDLGGGATELTAWAKLDADAPFVTNRAGFIILHPLRGVVGRALVARHPDGSRTDTRFPDLISPSQPVFGIAGLSHVVEGVSVDIAMQGELFEMEDQRNWSDASYKTYCRPLSAPRPYVLGPGRPVEQALTMRFSGRAAPAPLRAGMVHGNVPVLALSAEPGLTGVDATQALEAAGLSALNLRLVASAAGSWPSGLGKRAAGASTLRLELVLPFGARPEKAFAALASACRDEGVSPAEVLALPERYLASHQPEGPWPTPPAPADMILPLRAAFPQAAVGTGMLTNFTELNRHPPAPGADFVSFGTTALVHAADDQSVIQTLEALPDIFRSAHALAGGVPLRLGLMSIGMRSNPYGAGVAANPLGRRLAMAMDDPRQRALFAAAFLVGVVARATAGCVAGLSPAMTDGPLGLGTAQGQAWPILHVVRQVARLAGAKAEVWVDRHDGVTGVIAADGRGILANLGREDVELPFGSAVLGAENLGDALASAGWADTAPSTGTRLSPYALAFLKGARP